MNFLLFWVYTYCQGRLISRLGAPKSICMRGFSPKINNFGVWAVGGVKDFGGLSPCIPITSVTISLNQLGEKKNLKRVTVRDGMCGLSVDALRNCCSHFKLYHVDFSPFLAPMQNFIQIGQKTQKLEISTFGRFWLVGLVGLKMVVGI